MLTSSWTAKRNRPEHYKRVEFVDIEACDLAILFPRDIYKAQMGEKAF